MAFNLDLALLLAIAVSACSGTESNHPSAGGTSALGGSSSSGGMTNGGSATTTGGTALATSIGGHPSGGSPQVGGSQATGGRRTSIIGCDARPEGDATMCSGATPHFFSCVGDAPQNTGCKIRSIGDMTDTYCCP